MTRTETVVRPPTDAAIAAAGRALRAGRLVGMPTETVYGLAANALDADAVARVFEAKARPSFDPLIVHVPDVAALAGVLADPLTGAAAALAAAFWPGPLTLVARRHPRVPDLVTAGLDTVAVRIPAHPVAQALLRAAAVPLAAPSANRFGHVSPTRASHVAEQLGDAVAVVLDGGPCEVGVESTIVSVVGTVPAVLRHGGVSVEEITAVVGPVDQRLHSTDRPGGAPEAPGQLSRHYATRTPLRLVASPADGSGAALLVTCGPPPEGASGYDAVRVLSPTGDVRIAAQRLFAEMRALDAEGVTRIDAILPPDEGLGRAIRDRLRRAAAGSDRGV